MGYNMSTVLNVNVLRRVAAKLAVHSAINVIIWPFSILSRIPIISVGYCINSIFANIFGNQHNNDTKKVLIHVFIVRDYKERSTRENS